LNGVISFAASRLSGRRRSAKAKHAFGRFRRSSRVGPRERSETDEIGKVYEQNRQDALAADVFGSPAYVLDGEVFWGQDRIELLVDALRSGRQPYRSQA